MVNGIFEVVVSSTSYSDAKWKAEKMLEKIGMEGKVMEVEKEEGKTTQRI